jgi:hypothetical protein
MMSLKAEVDAALFRRTIVWISVSRLFGTVIAQAFFLPAAFTVAWIANHV